MTEMTMTETTTGADSTPTKAPRKRRPIKLPMSVEVDGAEVVTKIEAEDDEALGRAIAEARDHLERLQAAYPDPDAVSE